MKKVILAGALIGLVGGIVGATVASANPIPAEWLAIFPSALEADGTQLPAGGTGPAYYVWTDDANRTDFNVAWTGSGPYSFTGTIILEGASGDFDTFLFEETGDELKVNGAVVGENVTAEGTNASIDAYATNGYDGFTIALKDWTLPSYVGFDLKATEVGGSIVDMSNYIYLGSGLETAASLQAALGQVADEDFKLLAPVPEPATILLFGAGLAGLAGVSRRKKK